MKTLSLVLFFMVVSLFLSGVTNAPAPSENMIVPQDTIKVKKMSIEERKQMELKEWQMRSQRIDANMMKQQQQIMKMDSLLGRPDTTKIKK